MRRRLELLRKRPRPNKLYYKQRMDNGQLIRPLVLSTRLHILKVKQRDGLTFAQTAIRFSVGIASLTRWSKEVKPRKYRRLRGLKIDMEQLRQDIKSRPDAYQYERAARFGVSPKAIWQALRKLGVTYKKCVNTPQGERRQTACLVQENHPT